ncbi:MAG: ABC transporter permease, partial [Bacteroidia bacterium]
MRIIFGLLGESISFAVNSLVANKLRTILSLLGITIGIFAIIFVFTVLDSLEQNLRKSVESLGDNVIFLQKEPWQFGPDYPWWKYEKRPAIEYPVLDKIIKNCNSADAAAFVIYSTITVKHG